MIRIGIIGLGFMGRAHLENYVRLAKEGVAVQVTAICDADPAKLRGEGGGGNLDAGTSPLDLSSFSLYTSLQEMLDKEQLDAVDITLPTHLHRSVTVKCLEAGLHVLCEKPMASNEAECLEMLQASERTGKSLMIGQCLRFWPAYVYLRDLIAGGTYGKPTYAYFYRGGGTPDWGPWVLQKDKGGGALLDMHVHDTDVVNWLFGMPEAVSTQAVNVIPGSGYDIVSTHYRYGGSEVVHSQVDWTLNGDFGFEMGFRVNFERGNVQFSGGAVKVNPNDAPGFEADLAEDQGYYYELKYFVEKLLAGEPIEEAHPASTLSTIAIVEAELASADKRGEWVSLAGAAVR
ncbi:MULTISPECIES: Gfo/Idh/MocA family oxidoreductase [unclassified Paenibacillus]|uniref:Gfo/Idh/MocA family protein n=1 Tax=unclassified Paenibacillus TaxID=185978 RepID=UPI0009557A98|nr:MULTISPECIES: Gfo/Idh/MocA family oxidoreductase [unclassified Paenibacillus]ASS65173.1 Gfo/Idh/MocA family oxidoreductase [Paenibacillus sp. RUD330]SIQ45467.1 Predicted dehydrogenase [Paenibacillus sp. RU4X]SIQ67639.1 Predicted dehydrogenase [Paenibacillus sp. RU4T]